MNSSEPTSPSPDPFHYDVIVLGGGFAGIACARALSKSSAIKSVCLVARENYTVFQPMLPEVAAGSISPRHVVNPIRQFCSGIKVVRGELREIDGDNRHLDIDIGPHTAGLKLSYTQLVVALGAEIDLSRVPGMTEHALLMRNLGDAMKLRVSVLSRFEEANWIDDADKKRRLLRFVIVGGGYSGVETAGELYDLIAVLPKYYHNISAGDVEVVLVHSRDHLLPTLSAKLQTYALRKLRKRGIRVVLETRVRSITAQAVCLDDDTRLESATVVSTVGNAPHPAVLDLIHKQNLDAERGRVITDTHGLVPGSEPVWAIGDCAHFPLPDGSPSPATAQFAQRQGKHVGHNIIRRAKEKPLRPFRFKGLGEFAAIGHHNAVGEVLGVRFSGFCAWWMWRTIYLAKLPTLQRKLRVMIDWTFDLFFARDLNLLDPKYSTPLQELRLEAGDILFHPGEPAYSLYLVKNGIIELYDGDQLIKTLRAGDYFGERALLVEKKWLYQARCREEAFLVALPARQFHTIVGNSQALKELFTRSSQVYQAHDNLAGLHARMDESLKRRPASDWMNPDVHTLHPSMTIKGAVDLFRAQPHGSYPVVDDGGNLLGVLKRDDIYDAVKRSASGDDIILDTLSFRTLPTIPPDLPGDRILDLFVRSGKNKLLVTDPDDRLVGLITLMDVIARIEL